MEKLKPLTKKMNWTKSVYVDTRGTRHADPYKVLVLQPIDPNKTSPTYEDVFMFLESMLEVEAWNDNNLRRTPQLPDKINKLLQLIYKYVDGKET